MVTFSRPGYGGSTPRSAPGRMVDDLEQGLSGLLTPVDQAVLTAGFADWMSRTFHRAAAQGAVGVRDDGIAAVSPWGFDLADIAVPVAVWQGRQDAMVPYHHGEWLAAHVPAPRPTSSRTRDTCH